ncbi:MAG: methylated-DNA--[protein]-cysteine S-methyltransferase [Brevinematales bacterium]|nr:methylated-DNA--[protein]-cysteine S-methyltransferase [Brevinematales bacterium]
MHLIKIANPDIGIIVSIDDGRITRIETGAGGFPDEYGPAVETVYRQFRDYLDRKNFAFDLVYDERGLTGFQKTVYRELEKIPAGQTVTYSGLAERIGGKNRARAVARALAANPFPVAVPCHRVVGIRGLGGYSGGFETVRDPVRGLVYKVRLLRHEGVELPGFSAYAR